MYNQHECARLLRALHWASKKDSEDKEKLRKDEIKRRQTNALLSLQEQLRKEAVELSYNQWLEKKSNPGIRDRMPVTYARSTMSSRGDSKRLSVSTRKSIPHLRFSIKVNPKQAKRNIASVGKPDKLQPYTNYPPIGKSFGSRTSVHHLSKSRSEPQSMGRMSRSAVQSAGATPASVKHCNRTDHHQNAVVTKNNQRRSVRGGVESKEKRSHKSGYDVSKNQAEPQYNQTEKHELKTVNSVIDQNDTGKVDKEPIIAAGDNFRADVDKSEEQNNNIKGKDDIDEKVTEGLSPEEEEVIDELDFSTLRGNGALNDFIIDGDEDDLFHDVGQTNSLNALSLPNTLTKDRTPAEIIQLLRSFGGLSRSYNRSNSFSLGHSMVDKNRSQRRFSLGAIPEGRIVTSYSEEDQSSSQLLDKQFLESLIQSLNGGVSKTVQGAHIQHDHQGDSDLDSELESDDSETSSYFTSNGSGKGDFPAYLDDVHDQVCKDVSPIPKVEVSQDDMPSFISRPPSLKVVNLAWDPVSNSVQSHVSRSESPLPPPDFSQMEGRRTPTLRMTPPNSKQSHKLRSPTSSQKSAHSQRVRSSSPIPRDSSMVLSPSSSSSSVHCQFRSTSPWSLSPNGAYCSVNSVSLHPSANTEDLKVSDKLLQLLTPQVMIIHSVPHSR